MAADALPFEPPAKEPPRRKFQHRYWVHGLLFLLTLFTTTCAGSGHYIEFLYSKGSIGPDFIASLTFWQLFSTRWLVPGLLYSLPLLAILGAHEFGHYWYCRKHNVDASLPYFLPAPVPLTGTLGAVIRIREAFPSTRALFDIGVAGPIAGFIVLLPFLYWGVGHSAKMAILPNADVTYLGEPLLLKAIGWWHFGTLPQGVDITLHPVGFAAWFGMLATALNLLPFGQLDGGHISYAVLGRRSWIVSLVTLVVTILLVLWSFSWISMAIIMSAMAYFLGLRHPRVVDEGEPLGFNRQLVTLLAVVIFVICFTPVPIQLFFGK